MIATFGKLIAIAALVSLLVLVGVWVVAVLAVVAGMFGIAWLCNARFAISENGVLVGYYKRSTGFVRTKR